MLVLTRKIGESIVIGDDVEVKIVAVNGKTVKLGIEAPKNLSVHRKEVYEAICKENIKASAEGDVVNLASLIRKSG